MAEPTPPPDVNNKQENLADIAKKTKSDVKYKIEIKEGNQNLDTYSGAKTVDTGDLSKPFAKIVIEIAPPDLNQSEEEKKNESGEKTATSTETSSTKEQKPAQDPDTNMQAIQDDGFFHTTASTIGQQTENTEKQTASNYYEDQQPSSSTSYGGQNPENIQELGTSQTSQPFIDPASGRPTLRVAARMSANYYEDQQPSCSTSYGGQNPENLTKPGSTQTSLPFIDPSTGRPMFRVQRRSLPNYFEDQQPSSSTSYGGQNPEITKKPGSTQTFLPFIDPSTGRPMLRVQRRLLTDVFEDQQPSCSTSYGGQNPLNVDVPSYTSTWQQTMDAKMAMVQIPPNLVPSYYEDQQPSCSTSYGGQNPKNMEEAGTSYTFDPQPSCSTSYGGQSVEEPGTSYTSDQQSSRSTFYAGQNPENIKKPGTSQTSTGQQTMEPNMAIVQMPETLFPDFYQDQQPSCSNMGDEQTKKEEEGTSRTMASHRKSKGKYPHPLATELGCYSKGKEASSSPSSSKTTEQQTSTYPLSLKRTLWFPRNQPSAQPNKKPKRNRRSLIPMWDDDDDDEEDAVE